MKFRGGLDSKQKSYLPKQKPAAIMRSREANSKEFEGSLSDLPGLVLYLHLSGFQQFRS